MNTTPGIRKNEVRKWLDAHVNGVEGELEYHQIIGGHSNLTYTVMEESGRKWVLRRPPLGHVLATAHDMSREYRVIKALAESDVPVPKVVGLCEDTEINDAPFYVMDFVEGVVVRDAEIARSQSFSVRKKMGESLLGTLVSLHAVDVDQVGLGDLARKDAYIERQLKRWKAQFEQSTNRQITGVFEVHDKLLQNIPEQQGVGIVHGDYRLDNTIMTKTGEVAAVLDWELCTLGDVLSDLAAIISYSNDLTGMETQAMSVEGFPTPGEVHDLYDSLSERDLSKLDFYISFAYWRLACILEGVYTRYAAGVMGSEADAAAIEVFGERVLLLIDLANSTFQDFLKD
ncbi:MAG: phosphotransferase family protein [Acidimicrobiales bacterium]|nr:phosphotransferase family protein [Acidimicrobiales bacterium]